MPEFKAFFDQLATFCRIVVFDKAGVGLSDPIPKVRLLEERAAEIEAVMDAVGFGKPVLFAMSEGGPQAIMFAARRPERTRALILYGSLSTVLGDSWDELERDLERDPAELRARVLLEFGEKYTPSTEQLTHIQEMGRAGLSAWGSGAATKVFFPSVRSVRQLAMFERMCASPGMVLATIESLFRIDVRPILPTLTVPTLVPEVAMTGTVHHIFMHTPTAPLARRGPGLGMGDIIGRAEMVLRRRYDLDATDAHELLVKVSEQQNRSLSSVALTVTERLGVRAA
jgi:hypothetical protein